MELDTATKKLLSDPANNYARRRAWVIYHLKLKGESLASLARKAGVNRRQTQKALARSYPRMEAVIADALDIEVQDLFPERYGSRPRPGIRETSTTSSPGVETPQENKNIRNQQNRNDNDQENDMSPSSRGIIADIV